MKKKVSIVLILLCALVLTAVGCASGGEPEGEPLPAPVLRVDGNRLVWSEVAGCNGYEVYVGDTLLAVVFESSLELTITKVGEYSITVRAYKGDVYGKKSNAALYVVASQSPQEIVLSRPIVTLSGNTIRWEAVENASAYQIYANGEPIAEIFECAYTFAITALGEYRCKVRAISDQPGFLPSEFCEEIRYAVSDIAPPELSAETTDIQTEVLTEIDLTVAAGLVAADNYDVCPVIEFSCEAESAERAGSVFTFTQTGEFDVTATARDAAGNVSQALVLSVTVGKKQLACPIVSARENGVVWQSVPNASGYEVYVDDRLYCYTDQTFCNIEIETAGKYEITVRSLGDEELFLSSKKSVPVLFAVTCPPPAALSAPVIVAIGNRLSWQAVEHAARYAIYCDGQLLAKTQLTEYELFCNLLGNFMIYAIAESDSEAFIGSAKSNELTYIVRDGTPPVITAGKDRLTVKIGDKIDFFKEAEISVSDDFDMSPVILLDCGDHAAITGNQIVFYQSGTYTVTVTVTDAAGNSALKTIQVTVPAAEKLSAPAVSLVGNVLSWRGVDKAVKYELYINGSRFAEIEVSEENMYSFELTFTETGSYTAEIVAVPGSPAYVPSDKSSGAVYTVAPKPQKLPAPVLSLLDNVLSWNGINHATEYILYINNEQFATITADGKASYSFELTFTEAGSYTAEVIAVSDNPLYLASDKSSGAVYTVAPKPQKLPAPVLTLTDNVLSWQGVEHAAEYELYINGRYFALIQANAEASYSFELTFTEAGSYTAEVIARSDSPLHLASDKSNGVVYAVAPKPQKLPAPVLTLSDNVLSWQGVEHAAEYILYINNERFATITANGEVAYSFELTFTEAGSYTAELIAVSDNPLYLASDKSNGAVYTVAPKPQKLPAPVLTLTDNVLSWQGVEHAAEYILYINDERFATITANGEVAYSYELTFTEAGSYTAELIAISDNPLYLASDKSNPVIFTVKTYLSTMDNVYETSKSCTLTAETNTFTGGEGIRGENFVSGIKSINLLLGEAFDFTVADGKIGFYVFLSGVSGIRLALCSDNLQPCINLTPTMTPVGNGWYRVEFALSAFELKEDSSPLVNVLRIYAVSPADDAYLIIDGAEFM